MTYGGPSIGNIRENLRTLLLPSQHAETVIALKTILHPFHDKMKTVDILAVNHQN